MYAITRYVDSRTSARTRHLTCVSERLITSCTPSRTTSSRRGLRRLAVISFIFLNSSTFFHCFPLCSFLYFVEQYRFALSWHILSTMPPCHLLMCDEVWRVRCNAQYIYLFGYFEHYFTVLKSDNSKIIEQTRMAWQHNDVGITPTNANSLWWRGNTRMLASRQETLTVSDGVATQGCWHHANKR